SRSSLPPPTSTVVSAWISFSPRVEAAISTLLPYTPLFRSGGPVVQVCVFGVAAPEMTVTVHGVPSGAFTNPVPSLTLMWQCNVWFAAHAFVAFSLVNFVFGPMHVLWAFGESPTFVSAVLRF